MKGIRPSHFLATDEDFARAITSVLEHFNLDNDDTFRELLDRVILSTLQIDERHDLIELLTTKLAVITTIDPVELSATLVAGQGETKAQEEQDEIDMFIYCVKNSDKSGYRLAARIIFFCHMFKMERDLNRTEQMARVLFKLYKDGGDGILLSKYLDLLLSDYNQLPQIEYLNYLAAIRKDIVLMPELVPLLFTYSGQCVIKNLIEAEVLTMANTEADRECLALLSSASQDFNTLYNLHRLLVHGYTSAVITQLGETWYGNHQAVDALCKVNPTAIDAEELAQLNGASSLDFLFHAYVDSGFRLSSVTEDRLMTWVVDLLLKREEDLSVRVNGLHLLEAKFPGKVVSCLSDYLLQYLNGDHVEDRGVGEGDSKASEGNSIYYDQVFQFLQDNRIPLQDAAQLYESVLTYYLDKRERFFPLLKQYIQVESKSAVLYFMGYYKAFSRDEELRNVILRQSMQQLTDDALRTLTRFDINSHVQKLYTKLREFNLNYLEAVDGHVRAKRGFFSQCSSQDVVAHRVLVSVEGNDEYHFIKALEGPEIEASHMIKALVLPYRQEIQGMLKRIQLECENGHGLSHLDQFAGKPEAELIADSLVTTVDGLVDQFFERTPNDVYLPAHRSKDHYFITNPVVLYQFQPHDLLLMEQTLLRKYTDILTNLKGGVQDDRTYFTLITSENKMLVDPRNPSCRDNSAFQDFVETLKVNLHALKGLPPGPTVVLAGVVCVEGSQYISYLITCVSDKVQVFVFNPAPEDKPLVLADRGLELPAKTLLSQQITSAFDLVSPGCQVKFVPCPPALYDNGAASALQVLDDIFQYTQADEPVLEVTDQARFNESVMGYNRIEFSRLTRCVETGLCRYIYNQSVWRISLKIKSNWFDALQQPVADNFLVPTGSALFEIQRRGDCPITDSFTARLSCQLNPSMRDENAWDAAHQHHNRLDLIESVSKSLSESLSNQQVMKVAEQLVNTDADALYTTLKGWVRFNPSVNKLLEVLDSQRSIVSFESHIVDTVLALCRSAFYKWLPVLIKETAQGHPELFGIIRDYNGNVDEMLWLLNQYGSDAYYLLHILAKQDVYSTDVQIDKIIHQIKADAIERFSSLLLECFQKKINEGDVGIIDALLVRDPLEEFSRIILGVAQKYQDPFMQNFSQYISEEIAKKVFSIISLGIGKQLLWQVSADLCRVFKLHVDAQMDVCDSDYLASFYHKKDFNRNQWIEIISGLPNVDPLVQQYLPIIFRHPELRISLMYELHSVFLKSFNEKLSGDIDHFKTILLGRFITGDRDYLQGLEAAVMDRMFQPHLLAQTINLTECSVMIQFALNQVKTSQYRDFVSTSLRTPLVIYFNLDRMIGSLKQYRSSEYCIDAEKIDNVIGYLSRTVELYFSKPLGWFSEPRVKDIDRQIIAALNVALSPIFSDKNFRDRRQKMTKRSVFLRGILASILNVSDARRSSGSVFVINPCMTRQDAIDLDDKLHDYLRNVGLAIVSRPYFAGYNLLCMPSGYDDMEIRNGSITNLITNHCFDLHSESSLLSEHDIELIDSLSEISTWDEANQIEGLKSFIIGLYRHQVTGPLQSVLLDLLKDRRFVPVTGSLKFADLQAMISKYDRPGCSLRVRHIEGCEPYIARLAEPGLSWLSKMVTTEPKLVSDFRRFVGYLAKLRGSVTFDLSQYELKALDHLLSTYAATPGGSRHYALYQLVRRYCDYALSQEPLIPRVSATLGLLGSPAASAQGEHKASTRAGAGVG